jgi:hypothetical protein
MAIKAGYGDQLNIDPSKGSMQYGAYEFLINQYVKPRQQDTLSYSQYRSNYQGSKMSEADIRKSFDTLTNSASPGRLHETASVPIAAQMYKPEQSTIDGLSKQPNAMVAGGQIGNRTNAAYTEYKRLDKDTYQVSQYDIPRDKDFLQRLNNEATRINTASQQGNVTDPNRPAGQTGRLGRPNYSRASTILAGESGGLGGAATQLGA